MGPVGQISWNDGILFYGLIPIELGSIIPDIQQVTRVLVTAQLSFTVFSTHCHAGVVLIPRG